MTTTVHSGASPLPWLVARGVRASWRELPATLAAGLLTLLATVPLALAVVTAAPGWLVAATGLPLTLALTGLSRFTAAVARGERARPRLMARLDPGLALALAGGSALAGLGLTAGGAGALLGAAGAAGLLLVGPLALGYGGLRNRYGLGALRGGLILASYRPLWTLTLLGLAVLGGFAVFVSAGALALVVPPLLLSITASLVDHLLHEINSAHSHRGVGTS